MKKSPDILLIFTISLFSITACAQKTDTQPQLLKMLSTHINTVQNASKVEYAKLSVISVAQAQANALSAPDTITGYPPQGLLRKINPSQQKKLTVLLLDETNYFQSRIRCRNDYYVGLRFSDKRHRIEFSLGIPCNQAIRAKPSDERSVFWAASFSQDAASSITKILSSN